MVDRARLLGLANLANMGIVARTVNMHEAKTTLSKLVEEVERGGEVVIARAGEPVARLVPFRKRALRKLGQTAKLIYPPPAPAYRNPKRRRGAMARLQSRSASQR